MSVPDDRPPIAEQEMARIDALRRLQILDTPCEPAFDRVTALAARAFSVPIAQIALIDVKRQWLKACYGTDATETPRDVAFCNHTILDNEVLVVPDALRDERFVNNPLVTGEPHIRFYAGAPLITREGYAIGSLCLIDMKPREFSVQERQMLQDFAALVMDELELRLSARRLKEESATLKAIQAKLKRSEDRFENAFKKSAIGMALVAPDGRWLQVNAQLCEIVGYSEEELLSTDFQAITHPDDLEADLEQARRILNGEISTYQIEKRYRHKSGHSVWVLLHVSLVRDDVGQPLYFIKQIQDTTRRRAAEEMLRASENLLRSVLQSGLDGIIIIDEESHIIEWNPAAERIFGYTREQAIGRVLSEMIMPLELRSLHHAGIARFTATGEGPIFNQRLELPALCADGNSLTIELVIVAIPVDGHFVFAGFVRDITASKQAASAILAAKEDAEVQRKLAEEANQAKSDFLSRMSHELRTPLNAILGFAQLLQLSALPQDDEEAVQQVLKAGQHLLSLINEVLDIARIEAGQLTLSLEPCHLGEVVRDVLSLVRPLAMQRNIVLDDSELERCEIFVFADRQRLKQVLLNLVSNAVKYNHMEGTVALSYAEIENGDVRLFVRDNGIGIAAERMERLFQPFERLGAEATGIEGTGIGLALSKRLVEEMSGRIGVESRLGQGSTFWIEFIRAEEPQGHVGGQDAVWAKPETRTLAVNTEWVVLYVEDNLSNLRLVQRLLGHRPQVKLLTSMQGLMGFELARQHMPDLILLDVHLPDINGDEVLKMLQQDAATSSIPVVVISADATPRRAESLLEAGAKYCLQKPYDVREFLKILDETLVKENKSTD